MPTPRYASGMPNGHLAGELLRANSARLSNTFHIKTPRPAQLPNRQRVSDKNQVPNFAGSGTELCVRFGVPTFLNVEITVFMRRLASIRRHYSGKSSLSFAANHYSDNDQ